MGHGRPQNALVQARLQRGGETQRAEGEALQYNPSLVEKEAGLGRLGARQRFWVSVGIDMT